MTPDILNKAYRSLKKQEAPKLPKISKEIVNKIWEVLKSMLKKGV